MGTQILGPIEASLNSQNSPCGPGSLQLGRTGSSEQQVSAGQEGQEPLTLRPVGALDHSWCFENTLCLAVSNLAGIELYNFSNIISPAGWYRVSLSFPLQALSIDSQKPYFPDGIGYLLTVVFLPYWNLLSQSLFKLKTHRWERIHQRLTETGADPTVYVTWSGVALSEPQFLCMHGEWAGAEEPQT